ncbi:MAG: SMC-Scp complex subunit ScpB [Pseudomonadota bacterium]
MAAQHIEQAQIEQIVEAALLAADGPLTVASLVKLFQPGELDEENGSKQIRDAIKSLQEQCAERGVELHRVASGYRYQVRQEFSPWVSRLWEEKPPRYTRALLETLALVAYKQPVTRGDIEQVRGVSVSQNIMRTLLERDWVRVVGQREVPGRPSLYGTTKAFLDYFNLKSLEELPPLAEIKAILEPAVAASEEPAPRDEGGIQEPGHEAEGTLVAGVALPGDREPGDRESGDREPGDTDVEKAQQEAHQALDDAQHDAKAEPETGAQVVQLHAAQNPGHNS